MITKYFLLLCCGIMISCASSSKFDSEFDLLEDDEDRLDTEIGFVSKKAKIDQLKRTLQQVRTQIEERQRMLQELEKIKESVKPDSLAENESNY